MLLSASLNHANMICNILSLNNLPSSCPNPILLPLQKPPHRKDAHYHRPKPKPKPQPLVRPPKRGGLRRTTTTTTSDVLRLMDGLGLPIPMDIYASLIQECTHTLDAAGAIELHAHLSRSALRHCLPLLNHLLIMYLACGLVEDARKAFDEMTVRDSYSWAAIIAGYADTCYYQEAVNLFVKMQYRHQHPDNVNLLEFPIFWIITCILKACFHTSNLGLGKQIHGWVLKAGASLDSYLSSSLINFYGKLGCLDGANFIFDHTSRRNTVVWTTKIVNNCREQNFDEVLEAFKEMANSGIKKNSFTISSVLRACSRMSNGQCGRQVHSNAIKLGLESDDYVRCGLVDMYGRCGLLRDAKMAFEKIEGKRNAACWNSMLTSYINHGLCIEAIKLLYEMKVAGMEPEESLVNQVRCACGGKSLENKADGIC